MSLVKISDFAIRVPKEECAATLQLLVGEMVGRLKGYAFSFGKSQHWNIAPFKAVSESAIRTLTPQIAMFDEQYLVPPHEPL